MKLEHSLAPYSKICCSVTQLCPTLCDSIDCSIPGFPVPHISWSLLKLMSIDLVMPFNYLILCCPLLLPQSFPASGYFQMSWLFALGQSIGASASASVLSMNIQDWFPLGLTGLISLQSKGLSRVFSNTTVHKHQLFCPHPSLWSTLTSIHDYWKNHSFNQTELYWQSNVSAF